MGLLVPLLNVAVQRAVQSQGAVEVRETKGLAGKDGEPLFDLVHPRAMHGRKVQDEAGMGLKPRLDGLALVHAQVVEDEMDEGNGLGEAGVEKVEEGDKLLRALAGGVPADDFACSCVEGGEHLEHAVARVLVFDPYRLTSPSREGGGGALARLDIRLLIHKEHDLVAAEATRVEVEELLGRGGGSRVQRRVGR